jgi:hypothetical protein
MSHKDKTHEPTPTEPPTSSKAVPAVSRQGHEFITIGGNPGKNQIYKCQRCGYQTMSTVENAPPNPFTPACFVAPLAQPVKTP